VGLRILCSKVVNAPEYDRYASDKFPIMLVTFKELSPVSVSLSLL